MPEFVRQLEPPLFCEALALALHIPSASFALGRTMIFFKAGKGQATADHALTTHVYRLHAPCRHIP